MVVIGVHARRIIRGRGGSNVLRLEALVEHFLVLQLTAHKDVVLFCFLRICDGHVQLDWLNARVQIELVNQRGTEVFTILNLVLLALTHVLQVLHNFALRIRHLEVARHINLYP